MPSEPTSSRQFVGTSDGSRPQVGDMAPDFALRRTFDETISLDELVSSRPALLVFYVFDFGDV
ncbi:MAG: hypothetical protein ACR2N7_03790 [Acidimicrobiia bacterium]